jgi:hypothetical protein
VARGQQEGGGSDSMHFEENLKGSNILGFIACLLISFLICSGDLISYPLNPLPPCASKGILHRQYAKGQSTNTFYRVPSPLFLFYWLYVDFEDLKISYRIKSWDTLINIITVNLSTQRSV